MKKLVVAVAISLGLTSAVCADDAFSSQKFIGIEGAATSLQGDVGGVFATPDNKVNGIEYGLKIGAQNNMWRTTLVLDFFDKDDQNTEKFIGVFDYFITRNGEDNTVQIVEPYLGLNVGYVNYESTGIDESGLLYGGQAGLVVNLDDSLDIDLSYRYSLSTAKPFDHSGSVVLGLNYFY